MQIPQFWAEARLVAKVGGRDRVVRRFGWSDVDLADAERHAHERAAAAMAELQAGRKLAPRERKLEYGDDHGLPIREQVLARTAAAVVTRNAYGARCLNVPDVLFADIDVEPQNGEIIGVRAGCVGCMVFLLTALAALLLGHARFTVPFALAVVAIPVVGFHLLNRLLMAAPMVAWRRRRKLQHLLILANRLGERFALYETPNGFRLLALHRTFAPDGEVTAQLLASIGTDRVYARLCKVQACFRARLTAKPWRIGVQNAPSRAVWPVPPGRLAERDAWIADYETTAANFASCRYLQDLGNGPIAARCAEVQRLHDELCRARTDLPIA